MRASHMGWRLSIGVTLLLFLGGCAGERAADVAWRTLENAARAACESARTCDNVCPDGSTTDRTTRSCARTAPRD